MIEALQYVTLFVRDVRRSRRFYETLGLRTVHESPAFVLMDAGNAQVGLHAREGVQEGKTVNLHFRVSDVQAAYEALVQRGLSFEHPPRRQPWGLVSVALRDPDGYVVEIVSQP